MKSKSFIVALFTISTLGLMTSCADMFDIDSTRVVYEKDHNLDSTSDSVYTTLGVLQGMRQLADRYVILGEVRGDMCDINENTKTSLRNLANFNFDASNEYLDVKDYYAVINNCNYALAKLDTTITINNRREMVDEYAALLGIRAWTYLQLAINYGEIPYYTDPVTTMADLEAVAGMKMTIEEIAPDIVAQLVPYMDYILPAFGTSIPQNVYPILRLVAADFCLWSGDYESAVKYYEEYLMKNKSFTASWGKGDDTGYENGLLSLGGSYSIWDGDEKKPGRIPFAEEYGDFAKSVYGYENLAFIPMEASSANGLTSELFELFYSLDNTHYLYPSTSWKELSDKQILFDAEKSTTTNKYSVKASALAGGDMRKDLYYSMRSYEGENFDRYSKFSSSRIVYYRRAITYLRYAEALNALAKQKHDVAVVTADSAGLADSRQLARNAFYLLKDAYQVFFPVGSERREKYQRFEDELRDLFIGVHARGTGHVGRDVEHYVLTPTAIAARIPTDSVTFNDTILFIDELIIDELALESTLEGNRFGDLIRFAKRRKEWGDSEYRDFLANRVANRGVEDERNDSLYNKLNNSEDFWYLPLK